MKGDWVYVVKTHAGGMWGFDGVFKDEEKMRERRKLLMNDKIKVIVEVWDSSNGMRVRGGLPFERKERGDGE